MTMIMQYIFIIAGAWALWSAYTYPIRKVKKFLPTLPEYLETNPMCQTKTGIKCKVCGSKSIKNWGIRNRHDQYRMFICNHCDTHLYRSGWKITQ